MKKYATYIIIFLLIVSLVYIFLKDFFRQEDIRQKELVKLNKDIGRLEWTNKRLEQTIQEIPKDLELLEKIILENYGDRKLNEETIGFENEEKLD